MSNIKKLLSKNKINILKKMGHTCFEYKYDSKLNINQFIKSIGSVSSIAGRIIELDRSNLKGIIYDYSGQLEFKLNRTKNNTLLFKYIDIGDIVGLAQVSIKDKHCFCNKLTILTKTSLPINFKHNKNKKNILKFSFRRKIKI